MSRNSGPSRLTEGGDHTNFFAAEDGARAPVERLKPTLTFAKTLAFTATLILLGLPTSAQDTSEIITKEYEQGGIYEGTFKDGKRQGAGTMRYKTGEEATGAWENGALATDDAAPTEAATTQDDG